MRGCCGAASDTAAEAARLAVPVCDVPVDGNVGTVYTHEDSTIAVFAENLVGLGFLYSVSYVKSTPTHEKLFAHREVKSGPSATFLTSFFLGWVGLGLGGPSVSC